MSEKPTLDCTITIELSILTDRIPSLKEIYGAISINEETFPEVVMRVVEIDGIIVGGKFKGEA